MRWLPMLFLSLVCAGVGGPYCWAQGSPVARAALTGMPKWMDTPVVRTGDPVVLDGGRSSGRSPLRFSWAQVSGPSPLIWLDPNTARPQISGLAFGEYTVRLTVTDRNDRTSTADLVFGAVETDSQGLVKHDDPNVALVFGPLLPLGESPWPYLDERDQVLGDYFGDKLTTDPNEQDEWNQPLPGTVSIRNGSHEVTGEGTHFQTDFCGADGKPKEATARIVLWYPLPDGETGRRAYAVAQCTSDTALTIREVYKTTPDSAGLHYAKVSCAGCWVNGSNNINYYDNVLAYYSLYYRSGLTKYLTYATTLANRWWTQPWIDEGRACWFGGDYGPRCPPPRVRALTGLIWRAHEGRPDMWPALRRLIEVSKTGHLAKIADIRESGYNLAYVALASILDPDENKRSEYREDTLNSITNRWLANRQAEGNWIQWGWGYTDGWCGQVTVTKGSTTVVGHGTSDCWPANPTKPRMYFVRKGDSVAYEVVGGDRTKVVLDRPYEGTTGFTAGYEMNNLVGYGTQPFIMGVALQGMYFAWRATGSDAAKEMLLGGVRWIRSAGVQQSTRGLYYARGFLNCEPNPDDVSNCADGVGGARLFSGEVIGAFARAYLVQPDPDIRKTGDELVGAALGKLGGPESDSQFARELDLTTTYNKNKNFGFFFGFGAAPAWVGARLAGAE